MELASSWLFWALLAAIFAALTAIFAKIGLQGIDSDFATLVRSFVILVALSLFVWLAGKWSNPFQLSTRTLGFLCASGVTTGLSWVCYFRALQLGDASSVAPVDKLSLLIVVVLAVIFLGERPSLRDWTGIALIGVGTLLLALKK